MESLGHMRWTSTDTVGFAAASVILLVPVFFVAAWSPILAQGRSWGVEGLYAIVIALGIAFACSIIACWLNRRMARPTWVTHVGVTVIVGAALYLGYRLWA